MEQETSEPKKKTGNSIRIALVTLSLLTVASIGGLAYTIFSSNTQKNRINSQPMQHRVVKLLPSK